MTKGRDFLDKNLTAMEQAGNDNLLYLKFHPESAVKQGEYIDKKTKVVSMSPVRVVAVDAGYEPAVSSSRDVIYQGNGRNDHIPAKLYDVLQSLGEKITPLSEKITDIDTRLKHIEETEYVDDVPVTVVGQIGELLGKNPELGNAVISAIPGIISMITSTLQRFLPVQPAPVIPQAISGTNEPPASQADNEPAVLPPGVTVDEVVLNDALIRLAQKGMRIDTDLVLLANLAETNKTMFDMVLTQLRATAI